MGNCTVQFLSTFDIIKGGRFQNFSSCYFHNSLIYVEIMTQNVNFPIYYDQCSILPARLAKKLYKVTLIVNRSSHGL